MTKSTSIYPLYMAIARGEVEGFTVPAINIRTLTYDFARIIFRIMNEKEIGAVVFEISPTEMEYTDQSPKQYADSVLSAAEDEGYDGPVFLQGDHFQASKNKFSENRENEIERIKKLIDEALEAGFLNIDIDASTLIDLSEQDANIAQKDNFETTAILVNYIRSLNSPEVISIGGEIGHIGDRNSTQQDLDAFMTGLNPRLKGIGLSKISVATGTTHGGIPLPTGKLEEAKVNFGVLENLGKITREKYGLGGVVQHGASTLPNDLFHKFVKAKTLELHLSTRFQNIVFENLNEALKQEVYNWLKKNLKDEWEKDWNEEQFIYKTRKKALGPFKDKLSNLSSDEKRPILDALEKEIRFIFEALGIFNTLQNVSQYFDFLS